MKKILSVLNGKVESPPPVWLMRQAGRHLPEYRALREKAGGFLEMCLTPEIAVEATLQPVERYGVDAAILFSDILMVPYMLGQEVTFVEGEGPKLGELKVDALHADAAKIAPVIEAVRQVKARLPEDKTLIGFAGAPWTVASYMVRGHGGSELGDVNRFAARDPAAFEKLIDRIVDATLTFIEQQVEAGAEAIQLFDSWAGRCENMQRWVIEPTAAIVMILRARFPKLPIIGFPRLLGPKYYTAYAVQTGISAMAIDQEADLVEFMQTAARKVAVQGNLDPELLVKGGSEMKAAVDALLTQMEGTPYIFNLGHGVKPETPPEHVAELIGYIRGAGQAENSSHSV